MGLIMKNGIVLNIKELEKLFGCKILKNIVSLGLDTATKTGYAIATTYDKEVKISTGFINVDVKGITDKYERNRMRYEAVYSNLKGLIKQEHRVIIENVYYGRNPNTLIVLSRIGAIAWTLSKLKGCKVIKWRTANQARSLIGVKGNVKKPIVVEMVNNILGTNIKNDDIIDAIVLALNGIMNKEPKPTVKKKKKRRTKNGN